MAPANQAEVISGFIAACACVARQKNIPPEKSETLYIQPRPAGVITVDVKLIHVPLQQSFFLRRGTEGVKPRSLECAVPSQFRCTPGESGQRLHVRIFFAQVIKTVAQKSLIAVAETVIEAR